MTRDLVIAGDALGEAAARIREVATSLGRADEDCGAVRAALGDAAEVTALRDAMSTFAASWNVRRESLCGTLDSLSGVLFQVDGGFDDADRALSSAVGRGPEPVHRGDGVA